MPEYLPPGVFIQESNPGDQPIGGVATSTVGFFGIAERGPTAPALLTSFNDIAGCSAVTCSRGTRIAI